ncbi:MAG: hypothetical protein INQ03_25920 [Candidatus Heimdallarchaeota archaeon]|nr:hypothetical protein [Candidatus Heimdallarchaeota archaeon]
MEIDTNTATKEIFISKIIILSNSQNSIPDWKRLTEDYQDNYQRLGVDFGYYAVEKDMAIFKFGLWIFNPEKDIVSVLLQGTSGIIIIIDTLHHYDLNFMLLTLQKARMDGFIIPIYIYGVGEDHIHLNSDGFRIHNMSGTIDEDTFIDRYIEDNLQLLKEIKQNQQN